MLIGHGTDQQQQQRRRRRLEGLVGGEGEGEGIAESTTAASNSITEDGSAKQKSPGGILTDDSYSLDTIREILNTEFGPASSGLCFIAFRSLINAIVSLRLCAGNAADSSRQINVGGTDEHGNVTAMPVLAAIEDPSVRSSLLTDMIGSAEDALLNDLFFGGNCECLFWVPSEDRKKYLCSLFLVKGTTTKTRSKCQHKKENVTHPLIKSKDRTKTFHCLPQHMKEGFIYALYPCIAQLP